MTVFVIRFVTLAVLALVVGPTLVGAWRVRQSAMVQPLLAVSALALSAGYSQITLLLTSAPATSRTWVNLTASVVVIALLVWGVLNGPDVPSPPTVEARDELLHDLWSAIHVQRFEGHGPDSFYHGVIAAEAVLEAAGSTPLAVRAGPAQTNVAGGN